MNQPALQFRFYDRNASGGSKVLPFVKPALPEVEEAVWLDEDEIRQGIRESVRTGRPAAAIFMEMKQARR